MEAVAEGLERRGEAGKVKARLRAAPPPPHPQRGPGQGPPREGPAPPLLLGPLLLPPQLKCRSFSLLAHSYHLVGSIPSQKLTLRKALDLRRQALVNALIIEGDYRSSLSGFFSAAQISYPELQMFFATAILHVHLMQWDGESLVETAVNQCEQIWETIKPENRELCLGLLFYNKLLQILYRLRICDYKNTAQLLDKLDAAMRADLQQTQHVLDLTKELQALNRSLSRDDLHTRDRSAMSEKQAQLQEMLRVLTNTSDSNRTGVAGSGLVW